MSSPLYLGVNKESLKLNINKVSLSLPYFIFMITLLKKVSQALCFTALLTVLL